MIFVDTSFWFALRRRQDANHDVAVDVLRRHADQPLVTTNHVRGETWTLLRRREGHRAALAFLDAAASSPRLRVLHADDAAEGAALSWLRQHDEREFSFVDAVSFAVMRQLRLHEAFAFDGDFAAAGFVELR